MDELINRAPDEWHIAFVDYGVNVWWHRFLRRGFRHCWAFTYQPALDCWVLFEVGFEGLDVRALSGKQIDRLIAEALEHDGKVLRFKGRRRIVKRPLLFASCVTALKRLLGVGGCALTPHGLYRQLLRAGAVRTFQGD
jgi:hypothetical protein